ncbi:hypothetical protein ACSF85_08365 [Moraxella bovoculi]|uniref:hypothetical protein n=1 Tax=Moraxella bovoculi TaxID=386891 RepID=UPI003F5027AE
MSNNVQDKINFVNEQFQYQLARAEHYDKQDDSIRVDAYHKRAKQFEELAQFIQENCSQPPAITSSIYISPSDIKGIPPELLAQLNISDSDKQDFQIIEAIDNVGGVASIDKILVAYYHHTNEIFDRQKLMAKLYRMSVKGIVHSHPSKKGVYSTKPIEEKQIRGGENDEE